MTDTYDAGPLAPRDRTRSGHRRATLRRDRQPTQHDRRHGHVTSYTYDALGRMASVSAPDGGVTSYTYDAAGNKLHEHRRKRAHNVQ